MPANKTIREIPVGEVTAYPTGSAASPSIVFHDAYLRGNFDDGLYGTGTTVGIAVGGASVLQVAAASATFAQPVLLPDGTAGAPPLAFTGATDLGIYRPSGNILGLVAAGVEQVRVQANLLVLPSTGEIAWASGVLGNSADLTLSRDAANILAIRNGNNNQTMRFGTTNAAYAQISAVNELHTLSLAATSDTTITIPANALVIGVTVRVTTGITASAGTTFDVGVAGATTRYNPGAGAPAFTVNTTGVSPGTTNPTIYASATAIRFTCGGGGSFTAGVVRVTVHYISLSAATS